jgi:hypothetical protein
MKPLLPSIAFLFTIYCNAQEKCGTDEQHAWLMRQSQEYARLMQSRIPDSYISGRISNIPDTIPIVVHIVFVTNWLGTFGDIPDATINNAIDNLNKCFNDTEPGHVNIGLYFKLAQTDPDCYPTTGIVRVDASDDQEYVNGGVHYGNSPGGISQGQLAAKSYWDNTKYLNIWIVPKISDNNVGAFAYYPTGSKTVYDGIVLKQIGAMVHEMGHAFNLIHTFEGSMGNTCSLNNDCTADGDRICDTPPVLANINGCDPLAINPCTNQPYGEVVYNFMSYSSCRKQFTPMQRDRMRNALLIYRAPILGYNTESPPPQAPLISIAADDNDNIIDKNQLITFTPTVTGNSMIQYHWIKNNFEVATDRIYRSNTLSHGDEILCMIVDPALVCHTPVMSYSNKIKISTDHTHFVSIYPNPTFDRISAWSPADDIKINLIRLFSADGKLLDVKKIVSSSLVQYSLATRPTGLYFLEFTSSKGIDIVRVVKGEFTIY